MFGFPIQLTFNQNSNYHKTPIGGLFSLLIKLAMLAYVVIIFNRMFTYGDNKERTVINIIQQENGDGDSDSEQQEL